MPLVQGRKRRAQVEDDDDVPSPEPATQRRRGSPEASDNEEDGEDTGYGSDGATQGSTSLDQLVKKMVRLALACEYQRRPIRRAEIGEKVLVGGAGRRFKEVFNQSQIELRRVFGMEMVELPAREKVTLAQRRAAQKNTQSQGNKPVASWVLRSVLPGRFRDPAIIGPAAVPTEADESKYTATYSMLVTLVSLHGGQLPDAKLERYLRRLNMIDNTPIDGFERTDKLLKRLERDGYILKIKESTGTGEEDIYWVVGPRGKVEIGDDGVRGLTRSVYGEMDDDAEDDLERRIARSLGLGEKPVGRNNAESEPKKAGRRRRDAEEADEEEDDNDDEDEDEDEE